MTTFVRACIRHRLPLDGLECPRGHRSTMRLGRRKVRDEHPGEYTSDSPDSVTAWLVLHVPSGRVAVTVVGARCQWEPWIERAWDECDRETLAGRSAEGFTPAANRRQVRGEIRRSGHKRETGAHRGEGKGWNRRGHAA